MPFIRGGDRCGRGRGAVRGEKCGFEPRWLGGSEAGKPSGGSQEARVGRRRAALRQGAPPGRAAGSS